MVVLIDDVIRFGTKCNLQCSFCNILNNVEMEERTLREIKDLVDGKPQNVGFLSLSGGEPTLYPYLEEVIRYTKDKGWEVCVQTNAVLVDGDKAESLRKAGVDIAFVNFPSHLPGTYNELTGAGPGMFEKAVSGIKNLLAEGIHVVLNIVINTGNWDELPSYLHFVAEEFPGVGSVALSVIQPHGNARINSHLVPDYRELKPKLGQALRVAGDLGIGVSNPYCGLPLCMVPEELSLEGSSEFGAGCDVRGRMEMNAPLERLISDKMHTGSCRDCYLKNFCLGIWKAYPNIRGDVVEPPRRALRFWPNS